MDLLKIILSNAKKIKNIEKHLCCLDPNGNGCPPISAAVGNTITCNPDGIFSAGGGGGTLTGAVNGVNVDGTNVELGGPLIQDNTTITGTTSSQKLVFSGVSEELNSNYLDGFVQMVTTDGDPNSTALGISTVQNTSGIGIRINSDTGIDIEEAINFGLIINAIGSGIGAQIGADSSEAIIAFSNDGVGIWASSGSTYGVRAQSSTGIALYAQNADSTGNIVPLLVERNANLGVGPITPIATFTQKTSNIIPSNFGISIELKAAQVASATANTSKIVSRLVNQANNTSNTELWALNAGVEVQALTVYGLAGGKVGIATITTPTARLHLPAGTATATTAPLKFTSGVLLTTPETGAIEYDGVHFYGTIGSTRFQLDQQASLATNDMRFTIPATHTANASLTNTSPTLHIVDATSGDLTLTLAGNTGKVFIIKRIDASANNLILSASTGTIEGTPTANLNGQWQVTWLIFDGTNWIQLVF